MSRTSRIAGVPLAVGFCAGIVMLASQALACGTVNGCPGSGELCFPSASGSSGYISTSGDPTFVLGPIVESEQVDGTTGNKWWTLRFTVNPATTCFFGAGGNGFKTIPMPIGGAGEAMNACACGLTLPPGATLRGIAMRDKLLGFTASCDPAAWTAANSNSTGMAPFAGIDPGDLAQVQAQQPGAQALVSAGPYTINDSFFDIIVLVETPPTTMANEFATLGSLGLYGINDAGGNSSSVFPESDPNDFCTQGDPQILLYSPDGTVGVEQATWGEIKTLYKSSQEEE